VVTNGPVDGQADQALRGLTFYRTGSMEQASQLAEADPAVRAGRLAVEIMTWYCPPGTMTRPGRPRHAALNTPPEVLPVVHSPRPPGRWLMDRPRWSACPGFPLPGIIRRRRRLPGGRRRPR
jgi:hypothetical protein